MKTPKRKWLVETDEFGGYGEVRVEGRYRLKVERSDMGEGGPRGYCWEVRPVGKQSWVCYGYSPFDDTAKTAAMKFVRRIEAGRVALAKERRVKPDE